MTAPEHPDSLPRRLGHGVGVAAAALGLLMGGVGVGAAPSSLAAAERPGSWWIGVVVFLVLGVAGLVLAHWLRPWHQRPRRAVGGALLAWLAWGFGAMVMGAGSMVGLVLLFFGAWLHHRQHRRNRAQSEAERA